MLAAIANLETKVGQTLSALAEKVEAAKKRHALTRSRGGHDGSDGEERALGGRAVGSFGGGDGQPAAGDGGGHASGQHGGKRV